MHEQKNRRLYGRTNIQSRKKQEFHDHALLVVFAPGDALEL